jgi:hypothetical protein
LNKKTSRVIASYKLAQKSAMARSALARSMAEGELIRDELARTVTARSEIARNAVASAMAENAIARASNPQFGWTSFEFQRTRGGDHQDLLNHLQRVNIQLSLSNPDALRAMFEVTRNTHVHSAVGPESKPLVVAPIYVAPAEVAHPPIAMPPGYGMARLGNLLMFFSSKSAKRVIDETVGDYRCEMVDAEVRGASQRDLNLLRLKHWWGFLSAVGQMPIWGLIGRLMKVWKGS